MELTGIGEINESAFAHLMGGFSYSDCLLCVGAIEERIERLSRKNRRSYLTARSLCLKIS